MVIECGTEIKSRTLPFNYGINTMLGKKLNLFFFLLSPNLEIGIIVVK